MMRFAARLCTSGFFTEPFDGQSQENFIPRAYYRCNQCQLTAKLERGEWYDVPGEEVQQAAGNAADEQIGVPVRIHVSGGDAAGAIGDALQGTVAVRVDVDEDCRARRELLIEDTFRERIFEQLLDQAAEEGEGEGGLIAGLVAMIAPISAFSASRLSERDWSSL